MNLVGKIFRHVTKYFIRKAVSAPAQRMTESQVCERLEAMKDSNIEIVHKVIGYFVENGRLYIVQERYDVFLCLTDVWEGLKGNIGESRMEEMRDHAQCHDL